MSSPSKMGMHSSTKPKQPKGQWEVDRDPHYRTEVDWKLLSKVTEPTLEQTLNQLEKDQYHVEKCEALATNSAGSAQQYRILAKKITHYKYVLEDDEPGQEEGGAFGA